MPFDTHMLLPLFSWPLLPLLQVWFDDVSKVTLPAWPGQGMDAIVIFRTLSPFDSCLYSDTILLSAVICIFVSYPFVSWLVGVVVVIYVLLVSIVTIAM